MLSTKSFTVDPSYSPGGAEEAWLLPMLVSLLGGFGFAGLTFLFGIIRRILKAPKWSPPLGLTAGKTGFAAFLVVAVMGVFMYGTLRGGVSFGGGYTGQEVFNEVNRQRVSVGVGEVKLNEYLCDNLVNRWRVAKGGEFHQGFEEHVNAEGLRDYGFVEFGEILVTSPTAKEAVYWWSTSPGHKATMDAERWTDGCAYAAEGTAVVLLGHK
jgi:hypothetical protein